MKPETFKDLYSGLLSEEALEKVGPTEFREYPPDRIDALPIPSTDKSFLRVGLPADSAPFLSFGSSSSGLLEPIESVYPHAKPGFVSIGSNGWGDPICVALKDGSVVRLDHEDQFRPYYLARSVETLATILYYFQKAVLDKHWGEFREAVRQVDPEALDPNGFWVPEAAGF